MSNPNINVSANKLCFHSIGKLGMTKTKKRINKTPKENLSTPPAMIVEKNVTLREFVNALCIQISKSIQNHSER